MFCLTKLNSKIQGMLFSNINLRKELIRERSQSQRLMNTVHELLENETERDRSILQRFRKSSGNDNYKVQVPFDSADQNVFTLTEIRAICIRYRLRFLESVFFRSDFPYEAVSEIKSFENKFHTKAESFFLMAPSKAFELENINKDPLLFTRLADGRYYLIHQWGNDLAWHKRILSWPMQNFKSFFVTLWIVCILIVMLIPASAMNVINFTSEVYLRIWLTIHTFIGLMGLSLWAGLAFDKSFSSMNWNSKYYNY